MPARPPASFRSCQNQERAFAELSSVQNQERMSQAANQRSCRWRHVRHMCTVRTIYCPFFNLRNCKWAEPWTSDEDSHSWLLFALEYVGAWFAKARYCGVAGGQTIVAIFYFSFEINIIWWKFRYTTYVYRLWYHILYVCTHATFFLSSRVSGLPRYDLVNIGASPIIMGHGTIIHHWVKFVTVPSRANCLWLGNHANIECKIQERTFLGFSFFLSPLEVHIVKVKSGFGWPTLKGLHDQNRFSVLRRVHRAERLGQGSCGITACVHFQNTPLEKQKQQQQNTFVCHTPHDARKLQYALGKSPRNLGKSTSTLFSSLKKKFFFNHLKKHLWDRC